MLDLAPTTIGLIGVLTLFLLICARFPISLALLLVSIGGLVTLIGWSPTRSILASVPYDFASSWELSSIPTFLLMGALAYHSGMTADLYAAARIWLRGLPGGLAVASSFACAGFAAASGSSTATTVAMGRIAVPEMLRANYDKGLATGVISCAGTLGSLIPPSVLLILFGIFTSTSISALFLAGVLPGILTATIYALMIVIRCKLNPALAPTILGGSTLAEKFRALVRIWPLPLLTLGVIGSMYGGIATPTEAGAMGAVLAFLIALFTGQMSWNVLRASVSEALITTASIFFVSIGAVLFTRFMVFSNLPGVLTGLIDAWSLNLIVLLIVCSLVYLILGTFLEPMGLVLITIPIFVPAFQALDANLIWLGIIVVKFVEISLVTPPLGLNVFAMKVVVGDKVSIEQIFRGVLWFILCELLVVVLLVAWPQIALFLPGIDWTPTYF